MVRKSEACKKRLGLKKSSPLPWFLPPFILNKKKASEELILFRIAR